MTTDELSRDSQRLTRRVRFLLQDDRCALFPRGLETLRKLCVLAAISQCCLFLDRLRRERSTGDEVAGRVIARAHMEAWLLGMYLHLGDEQDLRNVAGSYRWQLERWNKALRRLDVELSIEGEPIELDLSRLIAQFGDVESKELKTIQIANRVYRSLKQRGSGTRPASEPVATTFYDFVYRALSTWGAHPNYGTLDAFIVRPGLFARVAPQADGLSGLLDGALHSAILLTADLAAGGFGDLGCDVTWLENLTERYVGSPTS